MYCKRLGATPQISPVIVEIINGRCMPVTGTVLSISTWAFWQNWATLRDDRNKPTMYILASKRFSAHATAAQICDARGEI